MKEGTPISRAFLRDARDKKAAQHAGLCGTRSFSLTGVDSILWQYIFSCGPPNKKQVFTWFFHMWRAQCGLSFRYLFDERRIFKAVISCHVSRICSPRIMQVGASTFPSCRLYAFLNRAR